MQATQVTEPLAPPVSGSSPPMAGHRIESIDILRALTMVLMIFVNDAGALKKIPEWLDHVKSGVDGIGLADVIFPAFLFIVGMSLPYAVANRRRKGDTNWQLIHHILFRTLALIVMGVFLVNGETISKTATGIGHYTWNTISCVCFILIWNVYPKELSQLRVKAAKVLGITTLAVMAYFYRGSDGGNLFRFSVQWWGILGLIGWSYLTVAVITVFSRGRILLLLAAWVGFSIIGVLYFEDYIGHSGITWYIPSPIVGGALVGLTMAGVVLSTAFEKLRSENMRMTLAFVLAAAVLFALTWYGHKFYPISKLDASLPWAYLCTGITILVFTAVYWIADVRGKAAWFAFIKPAGTDTLLCYLIPYFLVSLIYVSHIKVPAFFITGGVGLLKSAIFTGLCVWITARLNRAGVKLKL